MIVCDPLPLRAPDGVGLGWWRVMDAEQRAAEPRHLLLTHGTFSDRRVCMTLARAWARQGHVAWILEWRGHGSSDRVSGPYDMETVALCDIPAALQDLQARHSDAPLCAATHSGGGLALTMAPCVRARPGLRRGPHALAARPAGGGGRVDAPGGAHPGPPFAPGGTG